MRLHRDCCDLLWRVMAIAEGFEAGDRRSDSCDRDGHDATSSSELVPYGYSAQVRDKLCGFELNIYDTRGLHRHSTSGSHGECGRKLARHLESFGCHEVPVDGRCHVGVVYLAEGGHLAGLSPDGGKTL